MDPCSLFKDIISAFFGHSSAGKLTETPLRLTHSREKQKMIVRKFEHEESCGYQVDYKITMGS